MKLNIFRKLLLTILISGWFQNNGLAQGYIPFPMDSVHWRMNEYYRFFDCEEYVLFDYIYNGDMVISIIEKYILLMKLTFTSMAEWDVVHSTLHPTAKQSFEEFFRLKVIKGAPF